jgi:DNA-binding transcriptional LysR family regulator
MAHDTLRLLTRSGEPAHWRLTRGAETWDDLPPGRATINSPEVLMRLACADAGIAMLVDHFAVPHVQGGQLVQVLPEWTAPSHAAYAVFPGRRLMPSRTRVFLDAMAEEFSGPKCEAEQARLARGKRRTAADA